MNDTDVATLLRFGVSYGRSSVHMPSRMPEVRKHEHDRGCAPSEHGEATGGDDRSSVEPMNQHKHGERTRKDEMDRAALVQMKRTPAGPETETKEASSQLVDDMEKVRVATCACDRTLREPRQDSPGPEQEPAPDRDEENGQRGITRPKEVLHDRSFHPSPASSGGA